MQKVQQFKGSAPRCPMRSGCHIQAESQAAVVCLVFCRVTHRGRNAVRGKFEWQLLFIEQQLAVADVESLHRELKQLRRRAQSAAIGNRRARLVPVPAGMPNQSNYWI